MHSALTALQLDLLRRVRDGTLWGSAPGGLAQERDELVFLCSVGLLHSDGTPGVFELTDVASRYLSALEPSPKPPD